MMRAQVQAQRIGRKAIHKFVDHHQVPQGFAHFLPLVAYHGCMHPVTNVRIVVQERCYLGDLALMVRETKDPAASMNVDRFPKYLVAIVEHSMCQPGLQVPRSFPRLARRALGLAIKRNLKDRACSDLPGGCRVHWRLAASRFAGGG